MALTIKEKILSIGIAIIFVLFVGYGIEAFYPNPHWDEFCVDSIPYRELLTQEDCESSGGEWQPNPGIKRLPDEPDGWCNIYSKCEKEFQSYREGYNRNVFLVAVPVGLLTLVIAIFLTLESVSAGLMGGGVLTIIYGTIRYWSQLAKFGRFVTLGTVLAVLIWLGYKKFSPKKK